jgi:hypothetical protein
MIIEPENLATLRVGEAFRVAIRSMNMNTGFFDDAQKLYYATPQTLDGGKVQGHQHITIQKLSGLSAPDATKFDFFKGLNSLAIDNVLSVEVPQGVPNPGVYRICSITGTRGHQPIISPVLRRGPQDDCIRVNVLGEGIAKNETNVISNNATVQSNQTVIQAPNSPTASNNTSTVPVNNPNNATSSVLSNNINGSSGNNTVASSNSKKSTFGNLANRIGFDNPALNNIINRNLDNTFPKNQFLADPQSFSPNPFRSQPFQTQDQFRKEFVNDVTSQIQNDIFSSFSKYQGI